MKRKHKKIILVAIGIAISAVLLIALFYNINFRELKTALSSANYLWLIPNVLFVIVAMYQRALRWRTMIAPVKRVDYSKLLAATCIGFMANNVLPLRLGELVRAYSLAWQDRGVSKSAALGNIFVERMVFDLVALLLIFGAVIGFSDSPWNQQFEMGVAIAVAVAIIGLLAMLILAKKPEQAGNLTVKYLFFMPDNLKHNIKDVILKFSKGLEFLTNGRMAFSVSIQTIAIWALMGLSNYFVFLAFDFNLPISASYVLLVIVSISILIPSSPGFIGVYHAGAVWTLTAYGIDKEAALSFALVLHAAQYLPVTLMGFYFLKKEHLSLKKLEDEVVEETV